MTRLNEVLTERFGEGYRRAKLLSTIGLVISRTAIVLAVPILLFGLDQAGDNHLVEVLILWSVTGLAALIGYAIGKVVTVQSEALRATLDLAVNASSSLSEQERVEILSLPGKDSWRPFGLGADTQTDKAPVQPGATREEPTAAHSPITALIANNAVSTHSHFAPVWRSERHLARPGRRRSS